MQSGENFVGVAVEQPDEGHPLLFLVLKSPDVAFERLRSAFRDVSDLFERQMHQAVEQQLLRCLLVWGIGIHALGVDGEVLAECLKQDGFVGVVLELCDFVGQLLISPISKVVLDMCVLRVSR